MCDMSEGSLPPFRRIGLSFYPTKLVRRILGRIRPGKGTNEQNTERAKDSEPREKAASAIRKHENSQATLFERSERLSARAARLEWEGTPSDSANNRASRAKDEVRTSLMDLRSSFAASGGDVDAFDLELKRGYPDLEVLRNS